MSILKGNIKAKKRKGTSMGYLCPLE